MNYVIRPAVAADCAELERLVNSAYRGEASRAGWTTEADVLDGQRSDVNSLRADIARPGCRIYCLRDGAEGPILGCVLVEDRAFDNRSERYFGMLAVNPKLQAAGVGRHLLEHLESEARTLGHARITMRVLEHRHSLIAWYERRGYRATGEVEPFPYGDEAFGIPKREDLRFKVYIKEL